MKSPTQGLLISLANLQGEEPLSSLLDKESKTILHFICEKDIKVGESSLEALKYSEKKQKKTNQKPD